MFLESPPGMLLRSAQIRWIVGLTRHVADAKQLHETISLECADCFLSIGKKCPRLSTVYKDGHHNDLIRYETYVTSSPDHPNLTIFVAILVLPSLDMLAPRYFKLLISVFVS